MADHGIFIQFAPEIPGGVKTDKHEKWVEAIAVSFGVAAQRATVGAAAANAAQVRHSIDHTEISLTLRGGKWTSLLWDKFYKADPFTTVMIDQVQVQQDANANEKLVVANQLKLTDVYITSLGDAMTPDGDRIFTMSLAFANLVYTHDTGDPNAKKMASFERYNTRKNK